MAPVRRHRPAAIEGRVDAPDHHRCPQHPRPRKRRASGVHLPAHRPSTDKSMRILLPAEAGFLGSRLCERLVSEGHEVVCYDSLLTGDTYNLKNLWDNERFTYVKYNVVNYVGLDGPVDWVMHFASPASPLDYL